MRLRGLGIALVLVLAACASGKGAAPRTAAVEKPEREPTITAEPASSDASEAPDRLAEAQRARELRGVAEEHLASLAALSLADDDRETVAIVRGLLAESGAALDADDSTAALRLAEKAEMLARDLRNKLE